MAAIQALCRPGGSPCCENCQSASGSTNRVSPAASAIEIVDGATILVSPFTDTVYVA